MRICLVRFMDSASIDWRVQEDVVPVEGHGASRWQPRRLRFESILGVRHLSPVPDNWEELPPHVLELLCGLALTCERAA